MTDRILQKFPAAWYSKVSYAMGQAVDDKIKSLIIQLYAVFFGYRAHTSMASIFELYEGKVHYNVSANMKNWIEANTAIKSAAITAIRKSVKYLYEKMALEEYPVNDEELFFALKDYRLNLFTTIDNSKSEFKELETALTDGISSIFLLSKTSYPEKYYARTLNLRHDAVAKFGVLNNDSLESFWTNLVFELMYLASDDDERFSIQAHPVLLRNLSVQVANPPFGYPIWKSQAFIHRCLTTKESKPKVYPAGSL
jgi:hypothetical protein